MPALFLVVAPAFAAVLTSQPEIEHEDAGCIPRGEFTRFAARVSPPSSIRAVKLYFRSSLFPEFYFVPMSLNEAGAFEAVMPMASDETTRVVYYFEAVDLSFQTSRSEEIEVSVSDDLGCRRGPGAVALPGGSPAIMVGAVQAGAPAIPAGFQATGITGFLSAGGAVTSTGGIGVGVAVGAAAGAAAGVGLLVSNGGADSTEVPQGGGNTTSTSSASTSTTTSIGVGSTTSSSGPSTSSILETTTSTGGSTTTSSGPSTSSIPQTTTVPSLTACYTWQALGNCRVFFDSCSTPASSIARYEWRMLGPPVPEPPQVESFSFSFEADPRCQGTMTFNHPVRLTVYDGFGGSGSVQQNVSVRSGASSRTDGGASAILSFRSLLATQPPNENARGQIVVNSMRLLPSSGASPTTHEMRVRAGTVQIEVTLVSGVTAGSLWELDFSSSESVVPGSLRAESGAVSTAEPRRIVFRLNGDRGETFRFRLETR